MLESDAHLIHAILDVELLIAIRHEMVNSIPLLIASAKPGVQSTEPDYRAGWKTTMTLWGCCVI